MSAPKPPSWLRGFLSETAKLGFVFDGMTGGGHVRLRNHDKGVSYITPASPSDARYQRNALNDMERLSGRKLPRPNAAKYKTVRVGVSDMRMTMREREAVDNAEWLIGKAERLRSQWDEIVAKPTRDNAETARKILTDYENLRNQLARQHRIIPPLGV